MATETKNFQIIQKIGENTYLLVHPETSVDNIIVDENTNLKAALEKIKADIAAAAATGGVTSVNGETGAVTIDLSAFITKAVDDLVNYYTKTEMDGKVADLEGKISAIPKFKISVVEELPATGENATIYLISGGTESQNVYVEYIWTGTAFEKLGEQKLDLSDYVTSSALTSAIADFLKEGDVTSLIEEALTDYIKAEDVSAIGKSGKLADAEEDETHRLVTDSDKTNWNGAKTTAEAAKNAAETAQSAADAAQSAADDAQEAADGAQAAAEEAKGVADEAKATADGNVTEITNIKNGTTKVGAATNADNATSADTADKLAEEVGFSASGDVTATEVKFDGSGDVALVTELSKTGVSAGVYTAVEVDDKGRVQKGAAAFEVGKQGQETPSENLAIGGLFFKMI